MHGVATVVVAVYVKSRRPAGTRAVQSVVLRPLFVTSSFEPYPEWT
jgi:hypothetical protein